MINNIYSVISMIQDRSEWGCQHKGSIIRSTWWWFAAKSKQDVRRHDSNKNAKTDNSSWRGSNTWCQNKISSWRYKSWSSQKQKLAIWSKQRHSEPSVANATKKNRDRRPTMKCKEYQRSTQCCKQGFFQLAGSCMADLQATKLCKRCFENQLGSKRALRGSWERSQKRWCF